MQTCFKCLETIKNKYCCSCSTTQFSYCCLRCLLDDGKCKSQNCKNRAVEADEKGSDESSKTNTSPWVAIKQRAGYRNQSLLDPTTFVFQEGMSVYQNSKPVENGVSSQAMAKNVNNNNASECFMDVTESNDFDMDCSSKSDQYNGVLRTSRGNDFSQQMDVSIQSLESDANVCIAGSSSSVHQCLNSGRFNEDLRTICDKSREACVSHKRCDSVSSSSTSSSTESRTICDTSMEACASHMEACASHNSCDSASSSSNIDDNGADFGRGWWKQTPSTSNKKHNHVPRSERDDGHDFGSGWWKPRPKNKSETKSKKRNTSSSSDSTRKRIKNSETSDTEFGSGWWVGRLDKPTKASNEQNFKSGMDCSQKQKCSSSKNVHRTRRSVKTLSLETDQKPILDVVPYRSLENPSLCHEFLLHLTLLKKDLLDEEEDHGRKISVTFGSVPGLWKASLGGSQCSLLVKAVGKSSTHKNAVTVQDIHGHSTTVVFPFLKPRDTIPGTGEESSFIFLRSVHWHEFKNGKLGIMIEDQENVFINMVFDVSNST